MYYQKHLYIFFLTLALSLSFFSTSKAKEFFINGIEIQEKLENDFNKENLINKGFKEAFDELMNKLVQSKNLKSS
jgi:cell division protein FtsL